MSTRMKATTFAVVVLAAAGLAARSFFKPDAAADGDEEAFASVTEEEDAAGPSTENAAADVEPPPESAPVLCGPALDAIASLNKMAADKDAVFILLPGEDRKGAEAASRRIEAAIEKIESRGIRVAAFILEKGAADHARLAERLSIASFPSVLALGKGCGAAAVSGEITEAKLLRAFVLASQPRSGCGTSCGPSSTCP